MSLFLGNFLIALREGVEAALVVGILIAYLVKVGRKDVLPQLWLGVAVATLIPLTAGAYMTFGPYTLTFAAQEILGGTLSLLAAIFVTWMIIWMAKNGRAMHGEITAAAQKSLAVGSGASIVWLAIISVGREGIETAVFVWAAVKSTATTAVVMPVLGVLAGLIVAAIIGWLIYRGTKAINLRLFFLITGILLIFVAAGIVTYGIGDLQEAGVLPGFGIPAYDLSPYFDGSIPLLHPDAWWFVLADAMFQIHLSPTHLQVAAWWIYMLVVMPLFITFYLPRKNRAGIQMNPKQVRKLH